MNAVSLVRSIAKQPFVLAANFLAWKAGYHFPYTFTWKTKLDHVLERYEPDTTHYFKNAVKPGMVVADVGANLGYFTRLASSLVGPSGKVYAFEPDKDNFLLLQQNTRGLHNVFLINSAVSDVEGVVTFYLSHKMGWHSLVKDERTEGRKVEVPSMTLDTLLQDTNIDFVKIDVEGAEPLVFSGMTRLLEQKPIVVFEYNSWDKGQKALVDKLTESHAIFKIRPDGTLEKTTTSESRLGGKEGANLVLNDKAAS